MTAAKDYLERIRKADTKIETLTAIKQRVRERAMRTSPAIGPDGGPSTLKSDRVGNAAVEVADLERDIDKAVCRYTRQIRKTVRLIEQLDKPEYITLLSLRYIEYATFDHIAKEMGRSVQGIFYIHGRALEAFEQVMNRAKSEKNEKGETR